jgi:hypothetical protein
MFTYKGFLFKFIVFILLAFMVSFYRYQHASTRHMENAQLLSIKNERELNICNNIDTLEIKQKTACYKTFFNKYTVENTREKSIELFQNLAKKDENFIDNCHYVFHGIGAGEYQKQQNISKVFSVTMDSKLFDTFPTCSNGYFHGAVEAYAGETNNPKILLEKLDTVCGTQIPGVWDSHTPGIWASKQISIDCYHGIGHASFIQLENDLKESINLCNNLNTYAHMQQMCRTGIFMEYIRSKGYNTESKILTKDNKENTDLKAMSFAACENIELKYRGECFNQQAYLLEEFTTKQKEYTANIISCGKKFPNNQIERIYCIRTFKF